MKKITMKKSAKKEITMKKSAVKMITVKKSALTVIFVLAVFLLTPGFTSQATAVEFGVRGYYWFPTLKSTLRVDSNSVTGTDFDVKSTLGFSDEAIPSVEAFTGIGKHHISLMYSQVKYSGSNTLTTPITAGGKTYTVAVTGDFNLKMLDAEYQYDFIDLKNILAGFSIGAIGKIKYFDGESKMSNAARGDTTQSYRLAMPMVGAGVRLGLLANILEARAKVAAMGYSGSYIYEALADISYTPFPFIAIHAGYKSIDIKIDNVSNVTTTTSLQGPFAALTISW